MPPKVKFQLILYVKTVQVQHKVMKMKTAQTHTLNHKQYNRTQALTFDPRGVWTEALGAKDDWGWGGLVDADTSRHPVRGSTLW